MTTHPLLALLGQVGESSVGRLAELSGADRRAVRIVLLTANGQGLVEPDDQFVNWRLTELGHSSSARADDAMTS